MTTLTPRSDALTAALLLFLAGIVDAVAFVILQGNFVAFMSGNTTIFAVSLADAKTGLFALTGALIGVFFAGCLLGAALRRWGGKHALLEILAAVAAATIIGAALAPHYATAGMLLIGLGTGLVNSVLSTSSAVHPGLTYVTGTLVKSAHALIDGIGTGHPLAWLKTFRWWFLFGLGGFAGALAQAHIGTATLWIGAAIAVGVLLLHALPRSPRAAPAQP